MTLGFKIHESYILNPESDKSMQPQTDTEYKQLLTEVIKKQIVILGPDITLIKARNVPGLVVDNQGNVTEITGEPQQITQSLIDQFVQLSGLIVKKTMEPLLFYHTTPASPASETMQPSASNPTPMPNQIIASTQTPNPALAQPTPDMHNQIDNQTQQIINEALKQV